VYSTGTALPYTAAKFGAAQAQVIAQYPQQGSIFCYIGLQGFSVYVEFIKRHKTKSYFDNKK
jgi:hypothetical protein